ncbi:MULTISPECIES: WD40 repeat domain-containing protein [unclassified Synechocystis]|uniref:WD40 repeat domain-containing protein n=1 Tax=unclassified Synechocystis TaxID=2640012 RepID=UPI0003F6729B|nr:MULTISPECIES: WD40 repeat domain-containing protein [unclassified Synechocystis]AIE76026.1 beta transducin-like protein [Synechocystis sp. PCC 6714]MCT0255068.1 WD40 repeat domain-containing protein [Synechocystis sp. CS-94]
MANSFSPFKIPFAPFLLFSAIACSVYPLQNVGAEQIIPHPYSVAQNSSKPSVTVENLSGFQGIITALNVTPDGKYLAVATADEQITLINLANQEVVYAQRSPVNNFADLAISADGQWLAIAAGNNIDLRRVRDGMRVKTLSGHSDKVSGVAFSPDGERVVSVSGGDRTIRIWERQSGNLLQTLADNIGPTTSVVFTPDGSQFITGAIGDDRTIKFWDANDFQLLGTSPKQPGFINGLAVTPDGRKLVGAVRNFVKAWNLADAKELFTVKGPSLEINTVAVSPDSRWVATANKEGNIMIFDLVNGKQVTTLTGHKGWVLSLAFSPEGNILYSGAEDKTVKIWDLSPLTR